MPLKLNKITISNRRFTDTARTRTAQTLPPSSERLAGSERTGGEKDMEGAGSGRVDTQTGGVSNSHVTQRTEHARSGGRAGACNWICSRRQEQKWWSVGTSWRRTGFLHSQQMLTTSAVNCPFIVHKVRSRRVSCANHGGQAGISTRSLYTNNLSRQQRHEGFA